MKVVRQFVRNVVKRAGFAAGLVVVSVLSAPQQASAQAPYLLPYTINSLGQGTAPTVGQTCTGTNGIVGTAYDTFGDGCPITSGSVVIGATLDLHDIGVDAQGNIYFLDNQGNGFLRRIDARSGIVTAYVGLAAGTATVNCGIPTPTLDKYGDGCQANDGKANAVPATGTYQYSANLGKARGISVAKNGDVYLATYSEDIIHRVPVSTGTLTVVAGLLTGGTAAAPKGYVGSAGGYTGDGGIAGGYNGAKLNAPRGVGVDLAGNVYIADTANNVIRKVTASTGIISTVVGIYPGSSVAATAGATGDGGPATSATISAPEDVEADAQGNIYVADFGNSKVRMVYMGGAAQAAFIAKTNPGTTATVGNIYTVIGGGTGTYTAGTPVLATSIPVSNVRKIAVDNRGNIYVADNGNNVIWFIDLTTGYIRIVAGEAGKTSATGTFCAGGTAIGDGCPGTQAVLLSNSAMGVAVDAFGNVLISDSGDKELRRVSTNQTFAPTAFGSTLTQTMLVHFAAGDAPAATYTITGSTDFTVAAGTCVTNGDTTQDCTINVTFAPTRPGTEQASLNIASTTNGTAIIGISGFGTAAAVALDPGATSSFATALKSPQGIAQDGGGVTYVADTGNNRVLRYTGAGAFTILAGTGTAGFTGDNGQATLSTLNAPRAVTVARDGSILIADTGNNVIRSVSPVTGVISTYGGGGTTVCAAAVDTLGDGCPATQATFKAPAGIFADNDGNVYVSDTGNNVLRELTPAGYVVYLAGGATAVCSGGDTFGNGCTGNGVIFNGPTGITVDLVHNVYVADTGNNLVRKLTSAGTVSLIAGTGAPGASGNGGAATGAQLSSPTGVAVDAAGDIYIADTGNSVIRIVNGSGVISTTAGVLGASGTGTLPGSAFAVQLASPGGVVSTGQGRLLIADSGNNRVFADDRGSVTYDFGRTNQTFSSPTLQIQETSTGSATTSIASPLFTVTSTTPTGVNQFTLAGTGSTGCAAPSTLTPGASCLLSAQFTPTQLGVFNATYTETTTNTINAPKPFIALTGTGAVLTQTTSVTKVTTPATGSPTYAVPFVVTTTVTPASCNTAAPSCFPTGTVTFFVDGTQVGLPVAVSATGIASQTISGLSVGSHTIIAVYSGDSFYASSSAPMITIMIARGVTTTTVAASPLTGPQFGDITLSGAVTGPVATSFPTGNISFYAGSTLLTVTRKGQTSVNAGINPLNGTASLSDNHYIDQNGVAQLGNSFGLPAGTYALTAVYSGDTNYAPSTSVIATLVIAPDVASISLTTSPVSTGTAQGSTGLTTVFLSPQNTVSGVVTFACTGMPAHSDCTFSPTSLTLTPVAGAPSKQSTDVTFFTDVPASVLGSSSSPWAWTVLLTSLFTMVGFRRKLRRMRLLAAVALFGLLTGSAAVLTGCAGPSNTPTITPTGVYNVTITVTGSNAPTVSIPIVFTVTAGVPGQL